MSAYELECRSPSGGGTGLRATHRPAAPKRDSLEERVRNPKSDGALRRDRRQSERETPLVMSLMKSDRTKAPKSDRIQEWVFCYGTVIRS